MMNFMNLATDKPDWENKCFDGTITEKWKSEAAATSEYDFSDKMADWVYNSLSCGARLFTAYPRVSSLKIFK